ncbi:Acyl-CoA N-acyltransferases (NAT) superfamily protein [Thalictrum thalictroides]|uniref:Acyl-CoA N-acyltransferases (NAT) superfamily protein n=1 Tax=Thalictrum thalictroides TaxID=46969 RepID=A0A7J6WV32_THATH|nr:Acyl-CoA N-acyltransferases (NAT) superfamily protein [Thalictrum thalictroides]
MAGEGQHFLLYQKSCLVCQNISLLNSVHPFDNFKLLSEWQWSGVVLLLLMMMRICAQTSKLPLPPPPRSTFISTNPSHVNVVELRDLFASANLSCHRFPNLDSHGNVEPVDPVKLGIALSHSSVVLPSLQGLGIGRRILNRITRVLTSRGIYDISALCSEKERLFFEACGFGDDVLASTTMIYTKTPFGQKTEMVVPAGRKLLLLPASIANHY